VKRDEYEEAIVAAQKDLVHWCNEANFIEIDGFVATSAHYLIELSKRWDFDRDQARHLAHGRQGKRITIEEATAHSIKATKRHFREKTYKEWSEKYAPIPATKDPAPEPPREVQEAPPPPKSPRKRRRKRGPRKHAAKTSTPEVTSPV